jgi:hypothetical protein
MKKGIAVALGTLFVFALVMSGCSKPEEKAEVPQVEKQMVEEKAPAVSPEAVEKAEQPAEAAKEMGEKTEGSSESAAQQTETMTDKAAETAKEMGQQAVETSIDTMKEKAAEEGAPVPPKN